MRRCAGRPDRHVLPPPITLVLLRVSRLRRVLHEWCAPNDACELGDKPADQSRAGKQAALDRAELCIRTDLPPPAARSVALCRRAPSAPISCARRFVACATHKPRNSCKCAASSALLPPQHSGPLAVSFRTGALRSWSIFSANQVRANFLNPASSSIQLGICADSFCKNLWDACGDDIANLGSLDLLGLNVRWRVDSATR